MILKINNSEEISHSMEGNSRSATHEIINLLWNPKVDCYLHKSVPMVPNISQISPVRSLFFRILFSLVTLFLLVSKLYIQFLSHVPPRIYMVILSYNPWSNVRAKCLPFQHAVSLCPNLLSQNVCPQIICLRPLPYRLVIKFFIPNWTRTKPSPQHVSFY